MLFSIKQDSYITNNINYTEPRSALYTREWLRRA